GFAENRGALFLGVALPEQLLEHGARVAFLRQRLRRRPPRETRAAERRGELERWQPRVLANVPRRELIGADAGIGAADAVVPRLHAREPRHLDVAVRLRRFTRL